MAEVFRMATMLAFLRSSTWTSLWLKTLPANVKHEIDPNEYASLTDLLNQAFQKHGDNPFRFAWNAGMSYERVGPVVAGFRGLV
jgi:hypothetical protein